MSHDADFLLALKLQEEFNRTEENEREEDDFDANEFRGRKRIRKELNATQNIVNPEWETIDPTPDIHSLFGAFDLKFFQGKLKCVELEWSKKMYQCAGICYQRRNRLGMSITIRLSEPLLKLRSRRNLIETLLHEMIHAYLFILNIRESNGGHGPNFKKMMEGINRVAGTNITVYHTFHDEVELYKTHVWRCNGICQHRKPFYGWIKRTSNRAPGPNDFWWGRHQESCGGTFQKISEPEPKRKAKKSKFEPQASNTPKITNWMERNNNKATGNSGLSTKGGSSMGSKTVTIKRPPRVATINDEPTNQAKTYDPQSTVGSNLRNVHGFRDLNNSTAPSNVTKSFVASGNGIQLNSGKSNSVPVPVENVRNLWANRFPSATLPVETATSNTSNSKDDSVELADSEWRAIDDDIMVHDEKIEVFELSSDDEDDVDVKVKEEIKSRSNALENFTEHSQLIKQEILDDMDDDEIVFIDDDFDDSMVATVDTLSDESVIDDIFGSDTLIEEFNNINDVIMDDKENYGNPGREIISCPVCQDQMARDDLSSHLEGCNGITVRIEAKRSNKSRAQLPFYKNQPSTSKAPETVRPGNKRDMLRAAGYSDTVINQLMEETNEDREYNRRIEREMRIDELQRRQPTISINVENAAPTAVQEAPENNENQVACPICNAQVPQVTINDHLDECLNISAINEIV